MNITLFTFKWIFNNNSAVINAFTSYLLVLTVADMCMLSLLKMHSGSGLLALGWMKGTSCTGGCSTCSDPELQTER